MLQAEESGCAILPTIWTNLSGPPTTMFFQSVTNRGRIAEAQTRQLCQIRIHRNFLKAKPNPPPPWRLNGKGNYAAQDIGLQPIWRPIPILTNTYQSSERWKGEGKGKDSRKGSDKRKGKQLEGKGWISKQEVDGSYNNSPWSWGPHLWREPVRARAIVSHPISASMTWTWWFLSPLSGYVW